jgi:epsilon-lactone hydrolase
MASWRARLLNAMLRWGMKRHADKAIDLERSRRMMHRPPRRVLRVPEDIRITEVISEQGLRFDKVERIGAGAANGPVILYYLHGGGYFFGSPKTHRPIIISLAKALDGLAYGLDYRLAPEFPFPAAVEDAAEAYRWLVAMHPNARIVIAGDSAGGGLAIATAVGARTVGLPPPAALIAFSPWCDLACTGRSMVANARSCAMFRPDGIRRAAALYLAGSDPRDPRASPVYADLAGLPPMLLFASNQETLLDDAVRLAERARTAGVEVELVRRDSLPHVWPVFIHLLPEAREAVDQISTFVGRLGLMAPHSRQTGALPRTID